MEFGANAGKWLLLDTINSKMLGRFVRTETGLTGGVEIVLDRPVQIESMNVPAQGRLGQMEVQIKTLHLPPVPWRVQFDDQTEVHLPAGRVASYVWVDESEIVEKFDLDNAQKPKGKVVVVGK